MASQLSLKGIPFHPDNLSACLGQDAPTQLNFIGQGELPLAGSLALLCSAKAPAGILLAVHDLAQQWRAAGAPIISGFHSPVEQEALTILLRAPGRTILCPARGLPKRIKPAWQPAIDDGRLTLLSPFPDAVRRATKETAIYRNRIVASLADAVLIAYAHPGSSTEQLAQEVLGWDKPVFTLAHESNAPLQAMGAKIMEE
jgi:predicted Rossmann fold nucleotide-binding protein DprA/Smf involved in DNA uptake